MKSARHSSIGPPRGNVMPVPWSVLLFLCVSPVFGASLTAASGHRLVTEWPQPITVAPGVDIILPCRLDPAVDATRLTFQWSRPDSDPLRGAEYVFLRRGGVELKDMKIASYARRAAVSEDALQRGDLSLRIRNVTLQDDATFRCLVPALRSHVIVKLRVDANATKTSMAAQLPGNPATADPGVVTHTNGKDANNEDANGEDAKRLRPVVWTLPVLVALLLLMAVVAGVVARQKCRKMDDVHQTKSDCEQIKPLNVTS